MSCLGAENLDTISGIVEGLPPDARSRLIMTQGHGLNEPALES